MSGDGQGTPSRSSYVVPFAVTPLFPPNAEVRLGRSPQAFTPDKQTDRVRGKPRTIEKAATPPHATPFNGQNAKAASCSGARLGGLLLGDEG